MQIYIQILVRLFFQNRRVKRAHSLVRFRIFSMARHIKRISNHNLSPKPFHGLLVLSIGLYGGHRNIQHVYSVPSAEIVYGYVFTQTWQARAAFKPALTLRNSLKCQSQFLLNDSGQVSGLRVISIFLKSLCTHKESYWQGPNHPVTFTQKFMPF